MVAVVYSDGCGRHLVADSLEELHAFAKKIGIGRHWYHGARRGHPHYDVPLRLMREIVCNDEVAFITSSEVLRISRELAGGRR